MDERVVRYYITTRLTTRSATPLSYGFTTRLGSDSVYQFESSFAAMSAYPEYSLDVAIAEFFSRTSATRDACDTRAKDLGDGKVVSVTAQDNCSYSVYIGPELKFVVYFRLKSLSFQPEIAALAQGIYGPLVPKVSFYGKLGDERNEPLFVYAMNRIQDITHLDFALANGFLKNSDLNFVWRKTLMSDVARYGSSPFVFNLGECSV